MLKTISKEAAYHERTQNEPQDGDISPLDVNVTACPQEMQRWSNHAMYFVCSRFVVNVRSIQDSGIVHDGSPCPLTNAFATSFLYIVLFCIKEVVVLSVHGLTKIYFFIIGVCCLTLY